MGKWILFFLVFCSQLANARGGEVGNGGDAIAQGFTMAGYEAGRYLREYSYFAQSFGINPDHFLEVVQTTAVLTEDRVFLRDAEVDAVNFPELKEIRVNRTRWIQMLSLTDFAERQMSLALHEYLWVAGFDDTNYRISGRIVAAVMASRHQNSGNYQYSGQKNLEWVKRDLPIYGLSDLSFIDDLNGVAVTAEWLYRTSDGGRSWNVLKIFKKGSHKHPPFVQGVTMFSKQDILVIGTYVESDTNNIRQNEVVALRSVDGGVTFSEVTIDRFEGKDKWAGQLKRKGPYLVFGRKDGTAYYYSKDGGTKWNQTIPPLNAIGSEPSVTSDGIISVLRYKTSLSTRENMPCYFDVKTEGLWKCSEATSFDFPPEIGGQILGAIGILDDGRGFVGLGLEGIQQGALLNLNIRNHFGMSPALDNNASESCFHGIAIEPSMLMAVCLRTELGSIGMDTISTLYSSIDGGRVWVTEETGDFPYTSGYRILPHQMSDGSIEVFYIKGHQSYSIAKVKAPGP